MDNNQNTNTEFSEIDDFKELYNIRINKRTGWQTTLDYKLLDLAKKKEISLEQIKSLFYDYYFRKYPNNQALARIKHWFLQNVKIILKYSTLIVGLSAVIIPIYEIITETNESIKRKKTKDLKSYADYGTYLVNYRENIQPSISKILSHSNIRINGTIISLIGATNTKSQNNNQLHFKIVKSNNMDDYDEEGNYSQDSLEKDRFDNACKQLINATNSKTGYELYNSNNDYFKNLRKIHEFFGSLGFAINQEVVSFDNVYNLFTYPAYWDNEVVSVWASFDPLFEIENCLEKNWFGEGKPLKDFSYIFLQLGRNYHYKRIKLRQIELNCEDSKERNNKCEKLKQIKKIIEDYSANPSKLPWNQLYLGN